MSKIKLILIFLGSIVLFFLPILLNIRLPIWSNYRWVYFTWYSIFIGLLVFYIIIRKLGKKQITPEILSQPQMTTEQSKEVGRYYCVTNTDIGDNAKCEATDTITVGSESNQNVIAYHKYKLHNLEMYCHFFINLNKPTKVTDIRTDLNNIMTNPHNKPLTREYILEVCNLLAEKPQRIQKRVFKRFDTETGQLKEEVTKEQTEEEVKKQQEEAEEEKEREI